MKFILLTNSIICMLIALVYMIFPVLFISTNNSVGAAEIVAICRVLGFACLTPAFISLLASRIADNYQLILFSLFTLTLYHSGMLLAVGVNYSQNFMPAFLPLLHGIFAIAFFLLLRNHIKNKPA